LNPYRILSEELSAKRKSWSRRIEIFSSL